MLIPRPSRLFSRTRNIFPLNKSEIEVTLDSVKKVIEVPKVDIVSVELGRNTLDVIYEDGDGRCGHCAPPFICNVTAFKNHHHAPGVIVSDVVYIGVEHSVVRMSGSGTTTNAVDEGVEIYGSRRRVRVNFGGLCNDASVLAAGENRTNGTPHC